MKIFIKIFLARWDSSLVCLLYLIYQFSLTTYSFMIIHVELTPLSEITTTPRIVYILKIPVFAIAVEVMIFLQEVVLVKKWKR